MTNTKIKVEDLELEFEGYEGIAKVLDGIDLEIEHGQAVGLVGETGCGKSVTAESIIGTLEMPPGKIPAGKIRYNGDDIRSLDDDTAERLRRENMAMIPQNPMTSLNPVFTVGEQLSDIVTYQGEERVGLLEYVKDSLSGSDDVRGQVIEMLDEVELPGPENVYESYPVELSGGMRQRVLIAQALLGSPDFLIADEPGTALDVTIQAQILNLLQEEIEENDLSVLYITHNLGVAKQVTERIYVMYAGEIAESAPTKTLFDDPKHPYTRELLKSVPRIGQEMEEGIEGTIPDFVDPPEGCRFHPRCPYAVEGVCDEEDPPSVAVDDDHTVGCHLYRDDIDKPRPDTYELGNEPHDSEDKDVEDVAGQSTINDQTESKNVSVTAGDRHE